MRSNHWKLIAVMILSLLMLPMRAAAVGETTAYVVTKTDDTNDGVCDADCSLREAIATTISGETIHFSSALSGQTISLSATLVIDKDLTVDGSGLASQIHINGNDTLTVFQVASYVHATLRGLSIEHGLGMQGGGIYVSDEGELDVEDCSVLNNSATSGGGVYGGHAMLRFLNSVIRDNRATEQGGGVYVHGTGIYITKSMLFQNDAQRGGGLYINEGTVHIEESVFSGNTALYGGGMDLGNANLLALFDSTEIDNMAGYGGGIYQNSPMGTLTIAKSTFSGNKATIGEGGGVYTGGDLYLENSSFFANHAATFGGGIFNSEDLTVQSSTFSENGANLHGGAIYNQGRFNFANTILANSTSGADCYQSDTEGSGIFNNVRNLVEQSSAPPHQCGVPTLAVDPLLGPLQDHGGLTQTMAPVVTSPVIDAGSNSDCPPTDQRQVTRPQGNYCDMGAYETEKPIIISIRGMLLDSFLPALDHSQRVSYPGINGGPVILSTFDGTPLVASERVIYKVNGVNTSYSEIMAIPWMQLDTTYWLPWYNNVDLDSQVRMTNISGETTTVHVTVAAQDIPDGSFLVGPRETIRKSFPGVNNGPVRITSQQPLAVSERVIYKAAGGIPTSFSEMVGLPGKDVDTTYWLPWYNNVDLDTQLRIANATDQPAMVMVSIGGVPMPSFSLAGGASRRVSYAGVNDGPVQIVSTQDIIVAERVIYRAKGIPTSFSEMMALPQNQLNVTYWLPWYNNVDLDTQLRIANASIVPATVHLTLHGVELTGSPFTLDVGQSVRKSFPGVNDGPVKIFTDVPLVISARVIYKVNGVAASFSEVMPLSGNPVNISHVLPWYNDVDLDTQLRVGIPR